MLLKIGLVLPVAWLLGIVGEYRLGQNVHFLLLVRLMGRSNCQTWQVAAGETHTRLSLTDDLGS